MREISYQKMMPNFYQQILIIFSIAVSITKADWVKIPHVYSLTYEYRIKTVVNFPVALVLFPIRFHLILHKQASE
jgi:hypothetical protein